MEVYSSFGPQTREAHSYVVSQFYCEGFCRQSYETTRANIVDFEQKVWRISVKKFKPHKSKIKATLVESKTLKSENKEKLTKPFGRLAFCPYNNSEEAFSIALDNDEEFVVFHGGSRTSMTVNLPDLPRTKPGHAMYIYGAEYSTYDGIVAISFTWFAAIDRLRGSDNRDFRGSLSSSKSKSDASSILSSRSNSGTNPDFVPNYDSDTDSDSDLDPDRDDEDSDGAYTPPTSVGSDDEDDAVEECIDGHVQLVIMDADKKHRWFCFENKGIPLRKSKPVFHPGKPFLFIPLDESRIMAIDRLTGL